MPTSTIPDDSSAPDPQPGKATAPFDGTVIGIGASAGGLDALERLFQNLPLDTGAAFVVVQHLSPDHKSMMAQLLARHTQMPVVLVEDAMELVADRVHLIPPGSMLTVSDGQLHLAPKNPQLLSLPIDLFLTSLAKTYGSRAIGVILSGTGSDGTRGGVAINDAGGLLLAQDPDSARFDGMPRSVIATGRVDDVLSAEALGPRIVAHLHRMPGVSKKPRPTAAPGSAPPIAPLEEILILLQQLAGINFHDYKPDTLLRRIERRVAVRRVPDLQHYLRLLEGDPAEVVTLRRDLLIPVTRFFRDTEAFSQLAGALREWIQTQPERIEPLRVWVAGTSTGEEAYSIAMVLHEVFSEVGRWPGFKIFATDVEQQNIDTASAGLYSEAVVAEIGPERIERFFVKRENHFMIRNDLRQNIVFARHNVLEDPPFTRMDLVACRNLLIYLKPSAQERVLRRLQYALAPAGILFLGSSESLGSLQGEFSALSTRNKIYRVLRPARLPDTRTSLTRTSLGGPRARKRPPLQPDSIAIDTAHTRLLHDYAPPAILVTAGLDLIHVFGDVQRFLAFPEGLASLDLMRLLPRGFAAIAKAMLHKAAREGRRVYSEPIPLPDGRGCLVRLTAQPVTGQETGEATLLLAFEETPPPAIPTSGAELDLGAETAERIATLERELEATRESLQTAIEELETTNQELQATNEELMASNEELQSSNEELQSVNEELYTVNSENQERIEILNRLNADLDSMSKASRLATLFVDEQLRLTRFTPEASQVFRIRDGDLGRPLDDFSHRLEHPDFLGEIRRTMERNEPFEQEIARDDGRLYLTRIFPYKMPSLRLEGAVATFTDVTELDDTIRLRAILDTLPGSIAMLDRSGRVVAVNATSRTSAHVGSGLSFPGVGEDFDALCRNFSDASVAESVRDGIRAVLTGDHPMYQKDFAVATARERQMWRLLAFPARGAAGNTVLMQTDITAITTATGDGVRTAR